MSKKTDSIYKCLDNLDELKSRLSDCCKGGGAADGGWSGNLEQELEDIQFHFTQELRTLRFWFDSLYQYNGRSRSLSKKSASAKNGAKGGRPPKEISETKARIGELENVVIPELDHKIVMVDSNEELSDLERLRDEAQDELLMCRRKVEGWFLERRKLQGQSEV